MRISDIEGFFRELDRGIDRPVRVVVTGGAAAILFGATRATQDIDFEVAFKSASKRRAEGLWPDLQKKIDEVARATGISAQYSDDIDRWSSIAISTTKSTLYKRIGKVEVRILDAGSWAIGKLSRYLGSDVDDLVSVLSRMKPAPAPLARLWGKALADSPPSPAQTEYRRHVDHFFDTHGSRLWGKRANVEELKRAFLKAARDPRR